MQNPSASDPSFKAFLDKIQVQNNRNLSAQLLQLSAEREIAGEDDDKREKQLDAVIQGLKDINDTLSSIKSSSNSITGSKVSAPSSGLPAKAENLTLSEKLKTVVGGAKSIGNRFMKAGGNAVGAVTDAMTDPGAAIKSAYGNIKGVASGVLGTAKDILSTKADYSVEQERFATAFSKTGKGGLMQGKKTGKEVGAEVYNKLKAKQEELDKKKEEFKPFEEQGFAPKGKLKDIEKLEKELADIDPRVQKEEKKQDKKEKIEKKVSSKAQANPASASEASGSDEILKELQANNTTLGTLLSVTQSQLTSINAIKEALAPTTPKEIAEQKSAPSAEPAAPEGKTLGDAASEALSMIPDMGGRGGKGKAGKGLGGKILGGLGKAARFLGPAAAVAGAAYSGFEGYQNTNENFDLKEGEEATVGQKAASTLGGVASGLTFGLLDEKTAAQGIHKAGSYIGEKASSIGSSVSSFFGFGDKSKDVKPVTGATTEQAAVARSNFASVDPRRVDAGKGQTVAETSTENKDMEREAKKGGGNNTVVSNNVTNTETTKISPGVSNPRPEYSGSALDRYQSRIAVY